MAVAHASLTDPNLHEPKGAAAAAAGEFLVADGAGGTDFIKRVFKVDASITPASVAANTSAEQPHAVAGVLVASDKCIGIQQPAGFTAGTGIVGWRVSADGFVAITFGNFTGAPATPVAGTYTFIIYRT